MRIKTVNEIALPYTTFTKLKVQRDARIFVMQHTCIHISKEFRDLDFVSIAVPFLVSRLNLVEKL